MSEEKRTCAVIASILKPADDVRMFEKIARTIASTNCEVHSIGFGSTQIHKKDGVYLHGLGRFPRLSWARWKVSWSVLKKTLALRPTHFIITTHELLFTALLTKLFVKARIIYDVQENYYLNIKYTDAFPPMLKKLIAGFVRMKESVFARVIDRFLLAERIYADQLPFVSGRYTIIENKVRRPVVSIRKRNSDTINLLFTGTLADTTGVFIAIELAEKLYKVDARIRLTIAGFAPKETTLEKIRQTIKDKMFVSLIGGADIVSHNKIKEAIAQADFGIVSYPSNPATRGRIPTKLYEYLGYQLPILLIDRPEWIQLCAPMNAAVVFKYPLIELSTVISSMRSIPFYSSTPSGVYWENEEPSLLKAVFKR
jgi:glycosyltransferase involved in cell wall biosynthesis